MRSLGCNKQESPRAKTNVSRSHAFLHGTGFASVAGKRRLSDTVGAKDILRVATSNSARMNRLTGLNNPYQDDPPGLVEVETHADLLLIDGNPLVYTLLLADPDANLKIIKKDGVIYKNTFD